MAKELITCARGHYYDAAKFSSCPYCKPGGLAGISSDKTEPLNIETGAAEVQKMSETAPIPKDEDPLGKTVGMASWYAPGKKASDKTTVNPVVGWLVCISGPDFGKSFNLKAGKNYIGRDAQTSDVALLSDNAVSRTKHAILIFDPKSRKYYVQPGASSELYYLNGNVVLQVTELKDRDALTIGKSELKFVAFCDDTFSWTEE